MYTPVENSTQLSVTKGEKLEATIEGGGAEDIKYKRGTFSFSCNIRKGKSPGSSNARKLPFPTIDGYVNNQYSLLLQPEDPTCEGFYIEYGTVSVDESYSSSDGGMWLIQIDAIKPSYGDTVKWGIVKTTESGDTHNIEFKEGSSYDSGESAGGVDVSSATFNPVGSSEVSS